MKILMAGIVVLLCLVASPAMADVYVDAMDSPPAGTAVADHGYTQVNHFDGATGGSRAWSYNRVDYPGKLFAQQTVQGGTASAVLKNDQEDLQFVSGYAVSAEMTAWSSDVNNTWFAGVIVSEDLTLADNWLTFEWYAAEASYTGTWRIQSKAAGATSVTITNLTGLTNGYAAGGIVKLEGNADGTFNFIAGGQTVSDVVVAGIDARDMRKFGVEMGNYWSGRNLSSTFDDLTATVPEPATLGLLAVGAAGLLARKSRR